MKKYLLSLTAFAVAIAFSAFTTTKTSEKVFGKTVICKYLVFSLTGTTGETLFSNYSIQDNQPPASNCPSSGKVCWIRICYDDQTTTLEAAFNAFITASDAAPANNRISDDLNEDHISYEEKQ